MGLPKAGLDLGSCELVASEGTNTNTTFHVTSSGFLTGVNEHPSTSKAISLQNLQSPEASADTAPSQSLPSVKGSN